MVNSVAQDVAQLLNDNALGILATDLFAFQFADGIDAQTLVMETDAIPTEDKDQYEQPMFQVLVRGARQGPPATSYAIAKAAHEFLIAQPELVTINSTDYLGFEPLAGIAPLGRDENNRFVYSMNYYTFRNPN